ncbi:uncharacterized protein OCT59_000534 [Rhizophagus irregularis]|uniref:uncharacterized protein n=1 Tax=Rhizophagus irregularis TaxID=588596 RepID=UPI0019F6D4C4|nr:hypothetical protein OCT59_000534 [Rhizophagus irregularis]GET66626.1 hypothetical protein GLOIN_2v1776914 [Rhizophagus irregularis DAOM 181602=DAOM 197198]
MRVDLAEYTLLKEVEDALASIESFKKISEETRNFIKYSQKYRQIMHSKINFWSLEDSRINTLKEIQNWFVYDNKQKTESKGWISSQCQFDLILSINGFLRILKYLLSNYPGSIVQPKRISQDILEGLFGVIHEFGVDSSTHTLKSYGYALNKYQITALVSFEVKSFNYGKDSTGTGITTLIRSVFKNIFADNLIMGKVKIPLESYNKNVDQDNFKIIHLQNERCSLIKTILYKNSIDELLQKWQNIIKKIAQKAILKKIGVQWLANWHAHFENNLNNFKCSGI